jgi:hypothetical protein
MESVMISQLAAIILPFSLVWVADNGSVPNPIYTCQFKAGQIVIEQANEAGEVTVEVDGKARQYVMENRKLIPRDQGLPTLRFQPDLKQWQWLNDQGEPIESTVCTEKPSLKTG